MHYAVVVNSLRNILIITQSVLFESVIVCSVIFMNQHQPMLAEKKDKGVTIVCEK